MDKLTKKEKEWIKELEQLLKRQPKKLVLFATGELQILKSTPEHPDGMDLKTGRYSQDAWVYTINSPVDGGDF